MPRTSFHIHDILQLDSKPSQEETEVQGKREFISFDGTKHEKTIGGNSNDYLARNSRCREYHDPTERERCSVGVSTVLRAHDGHVATRVVREPEQRDPTTTATWVTGMAGWSNVTNYLASAFGRTQR